MTAQLQTMRDMVHAEVLKLRKRRGTVIWSLLLSPGTVALYFIWNLLHHNAGSDPVGGMHGFSRGLELVGIFMGPLAAVLIGAQAGAGDSASGVFRDLVLTGRSRAALFAARLPGALILCSLVNLLGYAVVVAATFAFADGSSTPSLGIVLQGLGWTLLVDGVVCLVAVGMASLTLSRPATITALVGLELVAGPLLLGARSLGSLRDALLDASVLNLDPVVPQGAPSIPESALVAAIVLGVWGLIATAVGAWRTLRVDA